MTTANPCRSSGHHQLLPACRFVLIQLIFILLQMLVNCRRCSAEDVDWLLKVTQPPAVSAAELSERLEPLLTDTAGHPVTTREQWLSRRQQLLTMWKQFLGSMPDPRPEVHLQVLTTEVVRCEPSETAGTNDAKTADTKTHHASDVTRQLVRYECEPQLFVEGYLLLPVRTDDNSGRLPAVVALHQTTDSSIDEIAGVSGSDAMQIGLKLAQRGFIVFCPRCFLWQDVTSLNEAVARHRSRHPETLGMAKMLYDAMRGVDVLVSLPEVDSDRIGAIGHSLGAKEALYLAAFDERVRAAVASEGGLSFRSTNWHASWYLGEAIRDPEFSLNHHQLLALIAPRPFLVLGGESGPGAADGDRSWPLITAAMPVWRLYGEPVRLGLLNHHEGHTVSAQSFERMAEWLEIYLQQDEQRP